MSKCFHVSHNQNQVDVVGNEWYWPASILRKRITFMDLSCAFDSTQRPDLFLKLQELGFPVRVCDILSDMYANLKFFVKSGNHYVRRFLTTIGLPQGNCMSPLMFNILLSDLPDFLNHVGPILNDVMIRVLLWADDITLLADDAEQLQKALDRLAQNCTDNGLTINVEKTKILVCHRGRLPSCNFTLHGKNLQIVKKFTFLGFVFTTQLSFTSHV